MLRLLEDLINVDGGSKMACKLIANNTLHNQLTLSSGMVKAYQIRVLDSMIVKVGARQRNVRLTVDMHQGENVIQISPDLIEYFLLPLDLPYDISFHNGELHIGPVIGLLLAHESKRLTKKRLKKFSTYTLKYENINGLVYVFSRDRINQNKKTITGYYYRPNVSTGKGSWKKATLPYPDVIFRRPRIPKKIYKHLKSEMGDKIINYPWFDKWETAQWLGKDELLNPYLPKTYLLHSAKNLDKMLDRYHAVFLKPVNSGLGDGIVTVKRKKNGDYFKYRPKLKGKAVKTKVTKNKKEFASMADKIIAREPYIVQQGISGITYKKRKIVFRVIMQKDSSRKWQCTGIVALMGHAGGLDSHSYHYGIQMPFKKALKKGGNLSSKAIKKIKKQMVDVCKRSCRALDLYSDGTYGDLGLDVVLDASYHSWLIEINVLHEYQVPLYINDKPMYRKMKTRILDYAKSLAGFYKDGEER